MKYYKLTNQNLQTRNKFQWKIGEWREAKGNVRNELCTNAWLHCYDSSLLAVLHNPIHANIKEPRLFEVEVDGGMKNNRGLKRGFRRMRLVKEISLPIITTVQQIAYGILCAKKVYKEKTWNKWADSWLSGENRDKGNATAAATAVVAAYAATAAAYVADIAITAAAHAAAYAAAADIAITAAITATVKIDAAATAVTIAAVCGRINLINLAKQAMKVR